MQTPMSPESAPDSRQRLFDHASSLIADLYGHEVTTEQVAAFLVEYFRHVDSSPLLQRSSTDFSRGIAHHLSLAYTRAPGETLVDIFLPTDDTHRWQADGHVVVLVVTDDKSGLVDTLSIAASTAGWEIRDLVHPQFQVSRNTDGDIIALENAHEPTPACSESWVWMELSQISGQAADSDIPPLRRSIHASLGDLEVATSDAEQMEQRLLEAAEQVRHSDADEAQIASTMLSWLAEGRFLLLGARDFDVDADQMRPRANGLGILRADSRAAASFDAIIDDDRALVITKDSHRSRVRRSTYLDYLGVRLRDGSTVVERRFLGLFTSATLSERVSEVPVLQPKTAEIVRAIGYAPGSYGERSVRAAIEDHPRDELFQASTQHLIPVIESIAGMDDPHKVQAFARTDPWGRFMTVLIYFPRDRYNMNVRIRITELLNRLTGATSNQWSVHVSESVLARIYFTMQLPHDEPAPTLDLTRLTHAIEQVTRTWDDRFMELTNRLDNHERGAGWSQAYKEANTPVEAVNDLVALNSITQDLDIAHIMYQPTPPENRVDFRVKMMSIGSALMLSDVLPHLSSLGVNVTDERPFEVDLRGQPAYIYDFGFELPGGSGRIRGWSHEARGRFTQALAASYIGLTEADDLNRLLVLTDLTWRDVSVLRAISRYLRQVGTTYSQPYIASTLVKNPEITANLVALFHAKFDPDYPEKGRRREKIHSIVGSIRAEMALLATADEDHIIRSFLDVIMSTVRTNFFAIDTGLLPSGTPVATHEALVFKIAPDRCRYLDIPLSHCELFVYSPQVEGVFIRTAEVARGPVRWSRRPEDYRSEAWSMLHSQTIKNASIVPDGAMGCFYPLGLADLSSSLRRDKAREAYRIFLEALLSVTDNMDADEVIHPARVVTYDSDDPYLAIAAGDQTIDFVADANQIAREKSYWMAEAFASHRDGVIGRKRREVVLQGVWTSADRHRRERGMSGDFLCAATGSPRDLAFDIDVESRRGMRLIACFDDEYLVIDPNPSREMSEHMSQLSECGASWADLDEDLLSDGGGVWSRSQPVVLSEPAATLLGLEEGTWDPNRVCQAILTASVDVLWLAMRGTFVKSRHEQHGEIFDYPNDPVRADVEELGAKIALEGRYRGFTQSARVTFAADGRGINTDFVDYSAGVDFDDQIANILLLLDAAQRDGRITQSERDELISTSLEHVATSVLRHVAHQNRAIAVTSSMAASNVGTHQQLIDWLTNAGYVDTVRDVLGLRNHPDPGGTMVTSLVAPQIAVLMASVKRALNDYVSASTLPDDPYVIARLSQYFPAPIVELLRDFLPQHRLAREIITSVAVNRFVDSQGITAAYRLSEETLSSIDQVIRAQLAARSVFDVSQIEKRCQLLDVSYVTQTRVFAQVRTLVETVARWLLHHYRDGIDIDHITRAYEPCVHELMDRLGDVLTPHGRTALDERVASLRADSVPAQVAHTVAAWTFAHLVMPIVEVALRGDEDVFTVARVYFAVSSLMGTDTVLEAADRLAQGTRWEILSRTSIRHELIDAQSVATWQVLQSYDYEITATDNAEQWWDEIPHGDSLKELLVGVADSYEGIEPFTVATAELRNVLHY